MNLYEGMFLLDNNVVREDWNEAKGTATGILEKHGASVTTARRWAERSLAYTIKKRNRGTFLLVHFEADPGNIAIIRRDLELNETVMRYLILTAEGVPEGESELHEAELSGDFSVPEPPEDHVVDSDEEEAEEGEGATEEAKAEEAKAEEAPAEEAKAEEAPAEEAKAEEAPAAEESATEEAEAPAEEASESSEEQTEEKSSEEA
ncbi:MAG: 30S ribosomal protein S6 [Planctomycetes bacterium]|nr:30S ribosomal protein S6 [Planctomycetota bacterium]